jgi:hypothetical protein
MGVSDVQVEISWPLGPHALKTKGCSFGMLMGAWVSLDIPKVPGRVLNQLMGAHSCMVLHAATPMQLLPAIPVDGPPSPALLDLSL